MKFEKNSKKFAYRSLKRVVFRLASYSESICYKVSKILLDGNEWNILFHVEYIGDVNSIEWAFNCSFLIILRNKSIFDPMCNTVFFSMRFIVRLKKTCNCWPKNWRLSAYWGLNWEAAWTPEYHSAVMPEGFQGALQWCRETPFSWTVVSLIVVVFPVWVYFFSILYKLYASIFQLNDKTINLV